MFEEKITEKPVLRFPGNIEGMDEVAVEEPLELRIDSKPIVVTMRTPGNDLELGAGFCLTEGIINRPDELESLEACYLATYGNIVMIELSEEAQRRQQNKLISDRRDFYISSSCGLCGVQSIDKIHKSLLFPIPQFQTTSSVLNSLPEKMKQGQTGFAHTGGLHAAAFFGTLGSLLILHEDIGRHNAVDKVIGDLLLSGQIPAPERILMLSSRISFELVQKAARAGIAIIAAIGAPSSLAIECAEKCGITLVGFLREGNRFNIYYDCERIRD